MNSAALELQRLSSVQRREEISLRIRKRLMEFLGFDSIDEIGPIDAFADLGTDSTQAIVFKSILESMFGCALRTSVLFEYPTVDALVALIDELTCKQSQSICEGQIEPQAKQVHLVATTAQFNKTESYPLSETQLGLWYISEALNYASSYHVPLLFRLKKPLDTLRWNRSLRTIATRHPALCVRFERDEVSGTIRQFPMPPDSMPPVQPIDLNSAGSIRQAMLCEVRRRFDLTSGPPLRSVNGCDDQGEFVLLVFHHIVADGLAAVPLISELWREYSRDQLDNNLNCDKEELFWRYLNLEQDYLHGEQFHRDTTYWKSQLANCSGDVGLLRSPELAGGESIRCESMTLDSSVTQRVRNLARILNAPLSTILLSVFYVLLARLGGKRDIAVTTPVSGRPGGPRGAYCDAVGCFINLIVTRAQIDENLPFRDWVGTVRQSFLAGVEHSHLPFARQLQAAGIRAVELNRGAFPVSFTYQNIFEAWEHDCEWTQVAELDYSLYQEVEDDLTLEIYDFGKTLQINWKFKTACYRSAAVKSWLQAYWHLLEQVQHDASIRIGELKLASPATQQQLTPILDRREEANLSPGNVVAWIDQQAECCPEATAIRCNGESITYRQLVLASRWYANHLKRQQIDVGHVVMLPAYRKLQTLVQMLAILRTGNAFLPTDPTAPTQRTQHMQEQALAKHCNFPDLPQESTSKHASSSANIDIIATQIHPESTAYVLFTSGSTGQPKGVPVRHYSLVNLCHAMIDLYQLKPTDRMLQFASLTFDMSIEEIFPTWCSGGCVVMRTEEEIEPTRLLQLVQDSGVTIANLPPSYHTALRRGGDGVAESFYRSLRIIAFGGDDLSNHVIKDVEQLGPRIFNVYGPTEATVNATATEIVRHDAVTIGRPLPGVAAYVCDSAFQVLPAYFPGELCLAGVGITHGYLANEEVADRFAQFLLPGDLNPSRVYRTGDRAIVTDEGNIVLLGRVDDQISIRGHRIEPGEIEKAIQSCSEELESAVVEADGRLCAFIKQSNGVQPSRAELTSFLREHLPTVMIPAHYFAIDAWPLNERGKVDRKSLRKQAIELMAEESRVLRGHASDVEFSLSNDSLWSTIASLMQETLHVEHVMPTDRFFDLGGHSLLAIIVLGKLNQSLGCNLSLRKFLGADTLADLHLLLMDALQEGEGDTTTVAHSYDPNHPMRGLLSPSQARLWFLDRLGEQAAYKIPALAKVNGSLDRQLLQQALQASAERHEILRTNFVEDNGQVVQVVHSEQCVPFDEQKFDTREAADAWIERQIKLPFDLADGPLWRVAVAGYDSNRTILLICMHHIITDGWSMRILIEELQTYFRHGTLKQLEPLKLQYADYAVAVATRPPSANSLAYWRQQLTGYADAELVTDFPRPIQLSTAGATLTTTLDRDTSQLIARFSRRLSVTPSSIWLAALYLLLRKRRSGDDLVFGLPVAGRSDPKCNNLIGFFVNTLAIRINGRSLNFGVTTRSEWIRCVAELVTDGLQHQDVAIEEVLNMLRPERRTDRSPLFQVLFSYAASVPSSFHLGNAQLHPYFPESHSAKFELTFSVNELEDHGKTVLAIEYATDLFCAKTIKSIAEQWLSIVTQLLREPEKSLSSIRLSESSLNLLSKDSPAEETVQPESFETAFQRQVAQHIAGNSEVPALVFGEHRLTYSELRSITDSLIADLAPHGNVLVSPVRSLESYLLCIAAMRSGRPFVFSPEQGSIPLSSDIAVLMPTSGSTGRSKSVAVRRPSLDHHAEHFISTFGIKTTDRIGQYATITFDLFLEELFPALRSGASVYVVPEEIRIDPRAFADWTRKHNITVLDLPTSVFHLLASDSLACAALSPSLRLIIVGGEKLLTPAAQVFATTCPNIQLWNTYGPTEATIICTAHRYNPALDVDDIPLGGPFAQANLVVVDPDGQTVPPGTPGELVIGGPGVAGGYVRDGLLVLDAGFKPHPIDAGQFVYWTGDRVVELGDRKLRFLGRVDDQIKIRGHRVETEEVAELLRADQRVRDVALVVSNETEASQLVAAICWIYDKSNQNAENERSFSVLCRELASKLPDFMQPSIWVPLETIPINARGKVDKAAILKLVKARERIEHPESTTECELLLLRVWADLLGHAQFSIDDNFFQVGGHSLLAARLVAAIEQQIQVRLKLADVFLYPTVRQMAERCLHSETSITRHSLLRFLPASAPSEYLTLIMPGLPGVGDFYYPLADLLIPHSDVLLMSLPGFCGDIPAKTIGEMSEKWFDALREFFESSPKKTIRLLAHSYSGSILAKLIATYAQQLPQFEQIVLVDCWPHVQSKPSEVLDPSWFNRIELGAIPGAEHVIQAALAAPSLAIHQPIETPVQIVVSNASRQFLDSKAWQQFFAQVACIESAGDHLSIMQPPTCLRWLKQLNLLPDSHT